MKNKKRLVYAEDVEDLINGLDSLPWEEDVQMLVNSLATADVVKVAHGHWLIDKSFMPFICMCSECGAVYDIDGAFDWKFCPICGARMDAQ